MTTAISRSVVKRVEAQPIAPEQREPVVERPCRWCGFELPEGREFLCSRECYLAEGGQL